jgi:diphosphomevalonate decarboxylase
MAKQTLFTITNQRYKTPVLMIYKEKDFICTAYNTSSLEEKTSIIQEAPSNIALVKYWGKLPKQIPMNPSVSFTLNQSKSITKADITKKEKGQNPISFEFKFEGKPKKSFEPKILQYLQNISPYVPFIKDFHFIFDSHNSFPHSSGIASSASGFAALSKIIIELEKKISTDQKTPDFWTKKTSFLARIGSGSAARSIEEPVTIWGEHPQISQSSDLYAIKPDFPIHKVFENYQDSIVLVEKEEKKVSSTAGHQLMNNHPFRELRKNQAFKNTIKILDILKNGDLNAFIELVENEALNLHAMMMTSKPNYILMQPETLHIIHQLREYRKKTGSKACFTLDAGANVHVLFPQKESQEVKNFLKTITHKEILEDYIKK